MNSRFTYSHINQCICEKDFITQNIVVRTQNIKQKIISIINKRTTIEFIFLHKIFLLYSLNILKFAISYILNILTHKDMKKKFLIKYLSCYQKI